MSDGCQNYDKGQMSAEELKRMMGQARSSFAAPPCYASLPPILDACCGGRSFWFDRKDSRALFMDRRRETWTVDIGTPGTIGRKPLVIDPDILADFTDIPFPAESFSLVVFDPPHIQREQPLGVFTKKYGCLNGDWREMLRRGFAECFRVLKPNGTLIFKWAESEFPVSEVLALTPEKPLFGHKSGKKMGTHWVAFLKHNAELSDARARDARTGTDAPRPRSLQ